MITAEEKLAKLREKQAQLKAQEKKIIAQENAKARKARTKRLIEIGAATVLQTSDLPNILQPSTRQLFEHSIPAMRLPCIFSSIPSHHDS